MLSAQPCTFFLIEDNAADVDLITRVLQKTDKTLQIHIASDGEEALKRLDEWGTNYPNPMVILLDLKLPKIDGLDVLRSIKKDARLKSLPVIVLTSSNQTQDIEQAYSHGANSYIIKAIDFDEFSKAIEMIHKYWGKLNVFPF